MAHMEPMEQLTSEEESAEISIIYSEPQGQTKDHQPNPTTSKSVNSLKTSRSKGNKVMFYTCSKCRELFPYLNQFLRHLSSHKADSNENTDTTTANSPAIIQSMVPAQQVKIELNVKDYFLVSCKNIIPTPTADVVCPSIKRESPLSEINENEEDLVVSDLSQEASILPIFDLPKTKSKHRTNKNRRVEMNIKSNKNFSKDYSSVDMPKPKTVPCLNCGWSSVGAPVPKLEMASSDTKIQINPKEESGNEISHTHATRSSINAKDNNTKPSTYSCEFCPQTFKSMRKLSYHRRLHTGVKPYSCKLCPAKFINVGELRGHLGTTHDIRWACRERKNQSDSTNTNSHTDLQNYKCQLCAKTFRSANLLKTHSRIKHNINEQKYSSKIRKPISILPYSRSPPEIINSSNNVQEVKQRNVGRPKKSFRDSSTVAKSCENVPGRSPATKQGLATTTRSGSHPCKYYCSKKFSSNEQLNAHWAMHRAEGAIGNLNSSSSSSKMSEIELLRHSLPNLTTTTTQVDDKKKYACGRCSKSYDRPRQLTTHRNMHGKKRKRRANNIVNNSTSQKSTKIIIETKPITKESITTAGNFFSCDRCHLRFKGLSELLAHKNAHMSSYPCKVCPRQFSAKKGLLIHSKIHNRETFKCKHCPRTFAKSRALLVHERIHGKASTSSEKRRFSCPTCSKTFTLKANMKIHEKIHSGAVVVVDEKRYECEECDKSYTQPSGLYYHFHHSGHSLSCKHCSRKFYSRYRLLAHQKLHTTQKQYSCKYCTQKFEQITELTSHIILTHSAKK